MGRKLQVKTKVGRPITVEKPTTSRPTLKPSVLQKRFKYGGRTKTK